MPWTTIVGQPAKWLPAFLLGLATIGAYGAVQYSIGVLIPVIHEDTGWSTGALSGAFSLGMLAQGLCAVAAGRVFDRRGAFEVLLTSIVLGSLLLLLASLAEETWQFVAAWAMGGAIIGGGLYYNLTMPIIVRLYLDDRAAALSVLTLLGALASPIFYPVAGWFIDLWGWRGALQGLVVLMAVCVLPAALFVRAPASNEVRARAPRTSLRQALSEPEAQRLLLVLGLAGVASSSLILHQVPAMQAAGLSLTTAASFAGIRGAFQIPGRLLLTPLTARFGVRGAIAICYAFAATAAFALLFAILGASTYLMATYFCAIGGMSLGLLSPLNGLFQADVFGNERLGTLSGVAVIVGSCAGAAGGFVSGLLVDLTGGYASTLVLAGILYLLAILALSWQAAAGRSLTLTSEATATELIRE